MTRLRAIGEAIVDVLLVLGFFAVVLASMAADELRAVFCGRESEL